MKSIGQISNLRRQTNNHFALFFNQLFLERNRLQGNIIKFPELTCQKEINMYATLTTLVDRLESHEMYQTSVISWSSPVPSFGNLSNSLVATLGLNPSNREFVDEYGEELDGEMRRFHTLKSLGLESWIEADTRHLEMIMDSCYGYFFVNPYDRWFKKLDKVLQGTFTSYYDAKRSACHLDLIPYATEQKWAELSRQQRSKLQKIAGDALGLLLRESPIRVLILNGQSVVEKFEEIADIQLNNQEISSWALPRKSTPDVRGIAYFGRIDRFSDIELKNEILVLGFNHNIQSSFGVTNKVIHSIRDWIAGVANGVLD